MRHHRHILTCVVAVLLAGIAAPTITWSKPELGANPSLPYEVSADQIRYEDDRQIYEAEGGVQIEQQGRVLTADWIMFSAESRVAVASGDVVIRDADEVVRAEFAWVDLETLQVLSMRASVDSARPGFLISGDQLERAGEKKYRVKGGLFTTCRCPPGGKPRPWEISTSQADVTVGGYAVARDVVFRTFGVPVLYAPIAVFPVKSDRQTGFLIPSVSGTSRGGTELSLPFFWAASESLNLTFTPMLFTKRGLKLDSEIEYVFGEEGYSRGGFALLRNDREIDDDDPAEQFSDDRYAFWLRHEQPLAPGVRFGLDLQRVSDNQYVVDFENFPRRARESRFLESNAWLSSGRDGFFGGIELSLVDDLQSPNDLDRDDFLLQRLPDIRGSWLPRSLGDIPLFAELDRREMLGDLLSSFQAGLDVRYTYFHQQEDLSSLRGAAAVGERFFDTGPDGLFDADEPNAAGVFDGADNHLDDAALGLGGEGDGIFQEGELLSDRGHRVDLYPKVSLPQQFGWVEMLSEVGYRETLYFAKDGGSQRRGLFTSRVDARMRLARTYQIGSLTLQHQMEPRIGFTALSGPRQRRNPLFVPEPAVRPERIIDADPRVLLRNPSDRISDERFMNVALANRIYATPLVAGGPVRQIAEFRIGGGYDFLDSRLTNVFLDANLKPNPSMSFNFEMGYDPKETRIEEASATFVARSATNYALTASAPERRHRASLTYRYVRDRQAVFENFLRSDDVFDDFESGLRRINQIGLDSSYVLTRQIDLFAGGYLSFEESSTRSGSFGISFLSGCACWELRGFVERRTRPDDTRLSIELRLAGIGK